MGQQHILANSQAGGPLQPEHSGPPFAGSQPESSNQGSTPDEEGHKASEHIHSVTISEGFWFAETPVLQSHLQRLELENPSAIRDPELPVVNISWTQACGHCRALTQIEGLDTEWEIRLPSEAQWEYARRAGTEGPTYSAHQDQTLSTQLAPLAWYARRNLGIEGLCPTKEKSPNPWGLYDMLGNVWEWCSDRYGPYSRRERYRPSRSNRRRRPHRSRRKLEQRCRLLPRCVALCLRSRSF